MAADHSGVGRLLHIRTLEETLIEECRRRDQREREEKELNAFLRERGELVAPRITPDSTTQMHNLRIAELRQELMQFYFPLKGSK